MDIYLVGDISVEDRKRAHLSGLAIREKYGVTYHQYWFNEEAGTVICLMEGPDMASCAATHLESNGFTACQIVEVEGGMYDLFMGKSQILDRGLVKLEDGNFNSGFRFFLTLDILAKTNGTEKKDFDQLKLPRKPKYKAIQLIEKCGGKELKTGGFACIVAVFKTSVNVLKCAREIQYEFLKYCGSDEGEEISFHMGISVGKPITDKEGFFCKEIQMSQRLCSIAGDGEITSYKLFEELCDMNDEVKIHQIIKILNPSEEDFLDRLFDISENRYADYNFCVNCLSKEIGISKPQLYRKITAVTGRSPVSFIRDIRLEKALSLIKENKYNISEIALEVGYQNPSYFSKCFHEKYGINPSKITF